MSKADFFNANASTDNALRIAAVFLTIDGETNAYHAGSWSTFIRLQGCRVGCHWCDTKYTWDPRKGISRSPNAIFHAVKELGAKKVTITGGEPMEQWGKALSDLIFQLWEEDINISMETAGAHPLVDIIKKHPYVNFIVDYKLKSSRAVKIPDLDAFTPLRASDVVKFVAGVDEIKEVDEAARTLRALGCRARFVVSPLWGDTSQLEAFLPAMLEYSFHSKGIGLSLQTHKVIWPNNVRDEEGLTL